MRTKLTIPAILATLVALGPMTASAATVPSAKPTPIKALVPSGIIRNDNGYKCLDAETDGGGDPHNNGDKVQLWDCVGTLQQQWEIWSDYTIRNANGGKCLDAETDGGGDPHNNGDKVQLWDCVGTLQQVWYFHHDGTITNANGGKCLDAETDDGGDPHNNGDKVQLWDCVGTLQQVWS